MKLFKKHYENSSYGGNKLADVHEEVKTLKSKMNALNQLVFGYLENSENCSD